MKLLSPAVRRRLAANFERGLRDADFDPVPVVRLFSSTGRAVWLASEILPDDDTLYGLVDLGAGHPALGPFSLADLTAIRPPPGLPVACDPAFASMHGLAVWAAASRLTGSILDAASLLDPLVREDPAAIRLLPRTP